MLGWPKLQGSDVVPAGLVGELPNTRLRRECIWDAAALVGAVLE